MACVRTTITGRSKEHSSPDVTSAQYVLHSIRDSLDHVQALASSAKHAMSEYIQLQKMASMERLASGVAHDMNNCIMVAAAETKLLMKHCKDNEMMLDRLSRIQKVFDDMESLIENLHQLGPEDFPADLVPRELSLEVKRVIDAMSSSFRQDIRLRLSLRGAPLPVRLCQGDTWRILSNLLTNAQEAMPDGGDLLVGTFQRKVDSQYCRKHGNARKGVFAVMYVEDHGEGMSQEVLDRIFDPLFTTKSEDQRSGKHGWGLAVVYALVNRRGGWIDVTSKIGQGTRFEVFLPLFNSKRL